MQLDPDICYLALESNDARFDGRFFAAVKTTGVYCRSVCPARIPRRRNVRFYPSAAAAEQAGFRPCRRCRPDAAPGSPEWHGSSAIVSRGLRMICEGALDGPGVSDLSARLGVGERQLSRLFVEHLGTSPLAVAQTRRAHFAKRLIEQSELPMTEVALSAGYRSVRRFNASLKRSFGRTPTELRRAARPASGETEITLHLSYRPPFDWEALLGFLGPRAIPGVESVADGAYRRTVADGAHAGILEVGQAAEPRTLHVTTSLPLSRSLLSIVERVRRLFDLRADSERIDRHLRADTLLRRAIGRRRGLRVPGAWDGFELAVRAILGQQVSVKGATTLAGRLAAAFGRPLKSAPPGGPSTLFPEARGLALADLESIGLPGARAGAIRSLAREVARGRIDLGASADPDETREQLCALPGVGPWTADYIAMRALGQPDAFPAGDLGLRKAISENGRPVSTAALSRRAEAWRPWRAYAAVYLWQSSHQGG